MSDSPYVIVPDGWEPPELCRTWEGGLKALPLKDIPNTYSHLVLNDRCKKILLVKDGVVVDENYQEVLKAYLVKRAEINKMLRDM